MRTALGLLSESNWTPLWHRVVYLMAAAPLVWFALWGWEHGAYLTFGMLALVCMGLSIQPVRLGAMILFWLFASGACVYGWLLAKDVVNLTTGWGAPQLHTADRVVFYVLELYVITVAVLLFVMSRPMGPRTGRG
jgi:hypothetical protein